MECWMLGFDKLDDTIWASVICQKRASLESSSIWVVKCLMTSNWCLSLEKRKSSQRVDLILLRNKYGWSTEWLLQMLLDFRTNQNEPADGLWSNPPFWSESFPQQQDWQVHLVIYIYLYPWNFNNPLNYWYRFTLPTLLHKANHLQDRVPRLNSTLSIILIVKLIEKVIQLTTSSQSIQHLGLRIPFQWHVLCWKRLCDLKVYLIPANWRKVLPMYMWRLIAFL